MKKKPSKAAELRQNQQYHSALESIRHIGHVAVTPEAACMLVWTNPGADIDALVDRLARHHSASGYRVPEIQKRAVDAEAEAIFKRSDPDTRTAVAGLLDRWYSRYLLAADVGFELGFAAANALSRR